MKEKIINTAIQVFNDQGLAAVSMKKIADELGISAGNLSYTHSYPYSLLSFLSKQ